MEPTDRLLLEQLGDRLSAHRLNRNLTQADLAREAGISKSTVERLESGQSSQLSSLLRVLRVLDLLPGLEQLVPPLPPSPVEQWRHRRPRRQRASRKPPPRTAGEGWQWGDGGPEG